MDNSMRKLATIRRVKEINPIKDADRIERITVDGWNVVAQKGLHEVGDLVVYCEVDSFLPIREEFEFLRKGSYKKMADGSEGFRLRTIKLKNQISQGLILPLDILPEYGLFREGDETEFTIGDDVTKLLGIIKYDPPIPAELSGEIKGSFPSFIPKTDEERIQNLVDKYEEFKKYKYYNSEKLDGTSCTMFYNNGHFGVCGRNWEYFETEKNILWKLARKYDVENKLKVLGNFAIQGECHGENIQKNPYKLIGQSIRFFNVFNIDKQEKLKFTEFVEFIKNINLETVPIISTNFTLPETIDELLIYADNKSLLNPKTEREGIVIRSLNGKISFKVISNNFLCKNE